MSKDDEFQRRLAADCFNRAWDLLDKKNRTPEEDTEMLGLAHVSRYHWGRVGTATNQAVGDWQLSRIYAALGTPYLALQYADSCLGICEANGLEEIMHTAHEGMARAYAAANDGPRAARHLDKARKMLSKQSLDEEDRRIYAGQIRETEKIIEKVGGLTNPGGRR